MADEIELLLEEEDEQPLSFEDLLRDAPSGCLFCRAGALGEGDDD